MWIVKVIELAPKKEGEKWHNETEIYTQSVDMLNLQGIIQAVNEPMNQILREVEESCTT